MAQRDDIFDELGDAWRRVGPREPGGPLDEEPREVQDAVRWLQRSWQALEVPAPPPLVRPTWHPPARSRFVRPVAAAAAVLLVALGAWHFTREAEPTAPSSLQLVGNKLAFESHELASQPRVLVSNERRVEMSAGTVKLILVPMETISADEE